MLGVNFVSVAAMSSATSGGFLLVYAAVNFAAYKLAPETGANRLVCGLAALLCLAALIITLWQFLADPATVSQAMAILGIVVAAVAIELAFRRYERFKG